MKDIFQLPQEERQKITSMFSSRLSDAKEVVFAFLHGSFLDATSFRDVDIAVFIDPDTLKGRDAFDLETKLASRIQLPYPIDLRIINFAPVAFKNNVGRTGRLIVSKNQRLLSDFLEDSSQIMVKDSYLMRESFEALAG